uniref:Putative der and-61 secreted protein n=1 Tax=Rhipicephalus pulchellus TaxID=72859 RepID=L7M0I1_RHIPC
MKLLLYAVVFCFVISLVTAQEDEEAGGEEEEAAPKGNENEKAAPAQKAERPKGGEEEEEEKPAAGPATPATTPPATPPAKPPSGGGGKLEEQATGAETKQSKKGGKRGPKRCRLSPANSNCIPKGGAKLWYYNESTQRCERHKVGGCPKLTGGFLFCKQCMSWCNRRISARKACLGIK